MVSVTKYITNQTSFAFRITSFPLNSMIWLSQYKLISKDRVDLKIISYAIGSKIPKSESDGPKMILTI